MDIKGYSEVRAFGWGGISQKAKGESCSPILSLPPEDLHCTGTETEGLLVGMWGPGQAPGGKGLSLDKYSLIKRLRRRVRLGGQETAELCVRVHLMLMWFSNVLIWLSHYPDTDQQSVLQEAKSWKGQKGGNGVIKPHSASQGSCRLALSLRGAG